MLIQCRLAYFCSEVMLDGMKKAGEDSARLLNTYIKLYNDCLKDHPKDMVCGLHRESAIGFSCSNGLQYGLCESVCRGNFKDGLHFSEGGYDRIAARMFNEINFDVYYVCFRQRSQSVV